MSTPYTTAAGTVLRDETRRALDMYAQHGVSPGDFLEAALRNDFSEAIGRADSKSLAEIEAIATYIHYRMPANCHGSPEIVRQWVNLKTHEEIDERSKQ